jgi:hypothetical protein
LQRLHALENREDSKDEQEEGEDPAGGVSRGSGIFLAASKAFLAKELQEQTSACPASAQVGAVEVLASSQEVIDGVELNMSCKVIGTVTATYHSIVVDWEVPDASSDLSWAKEGLVPHVELPYENDQPVAWCELLTKSTYAVLSEIASEEGHEAVSNYYQMLGVLDETSGNETLTAGGAAAVCKGSNALPAEYNPATMNQHKSCFARGAVTSQGGCGSCWAFAAGHAVQSRMCMKNKADLKFPSVQQVLSCSDSKQGCKGGWPSSAFAEWQKAGMALASDYKYAPGGSSFPWHRAGEKCGWGNYMKPYRVSTAYRVNLGSSSQRVQNMQKELFCNGPYTVAFWVYENFFRAKDMYTSIAGRKAGGHAVVNVGWGTKNGVPYWEIMNSWGSNWGNGGFIKFKRGINLCNIEGGWCHSAANVEKTQASWKFTSWKCDKASGDKKRGIACIDATGAPASDSRCPVHSRWPNKGTFPSGSRPAEQRPVAIDKCKPSDLGCTAFYCNSNGQASNATGTCICTCKAGYANSRCDTCAAGFQGYPTCRESCTRAADCSGNGKASGVKWKNEFGAPMDSCSCVCDSGFQGSKCQQTRVACTKFASASTCPNPGCFWGTDGKCQHAIGTMSTGNNGRYGSGTSQRAFSALTEPIKMNVSFVGTNDAHIYLSSGGYPNRRTNGYEIVLGGWSNKRSVIRAMDPQTRNREVASISGKMVGGGAKSFQILKERTTIKVTREGETSPILTFNRASLAIKEVYLMTGWGSTGKWNFEIGTTQPPMPTTSTTLPPTTQPPTPTTQPPLTTQAPTILPSTTTMTTTNMDIVIPVEVNASEVDHFDIKVQLTK